MSDFNLPTIDGKMFYRSKIVLEKTVKKEQVKSECKNIIQEIAEQQQRQLQKLNTLNMRSALKMYFNNYHL